MSQSFARRERLALCDLALQLGQDASTLSGEWTASDLVVHLLVRENNPLGALGILAAPLSGLTDRASAGWHELDFAQQVERLREPRLRPFTVRGVDAFINPHEFFVHHEDLRRAQPDWTPRPLATADEDLLWRLVGRFGRLLARPVGVPLVVRRAGHEHVRSRLVRGAEPVTITGDPGELLLFCFGRDQVVGLEFDGPEDGVRRVREADFGL